MFLCAIHTKSINIKHYITVGILVKQGIKSELTLSAVLNLKLSSNLTAKRTHWRKLLLTNGNTCTEIETIIPSGRKYQ